jgi:hypothetical protein
MTKTLTRGVLVAGFALLAGLFTVDGTEAAAVLSVTQIECGQPFHAGQFDAVYIVNQGDTAQNMAGWQLRSDPEDSQQLELSLLGVLDPGEQVILTAGGHAVAVPSENIVVWTLNEMLRDSGSPPDYVRLLDPSGSLVSGRDCAGQVFLPATPTPAPQQQTQQPGQQQTAQTGTGTGAGTGTGKGKGPRAVPAAGGPVASEDGAFAMLPLISGLIAISAGTVAMNVAFAGRKTGVKRRERW